MPSTGLLQGEKAVFYLPCDQLPLNEIVKNQTWYDRGRWGGSSPPSAENVSGVVVSGIVPIDVIFSPNNDTFHDTDSTVYEDITGSSGLCLALWGLGPFGAPIFKFKAGFGSPLVAEVDNGITIEHSLGVTDVRLYASGNASTVVPISHIIDSTTFFVFDIRLSGGTTWLVRSSINGNDWSSPISINFTSNFNNSDYVRISLYNSPTIHPVDEVILWSDNILFTSQELSNLYELGNTLVEPMTSYSGAFIFQPASGLSDLFIQGHEEINNSPGGASLFIESSVTIQTSGDLFLLGPTIGVKNATTNIFINGVTPKPSTACPTLDPTASIQIKDSLIRIYQSRIDALINQLGKNVTLEFTPIRGPCPNCKYDTIRKRSLGIYIPGGPRPFVRGRRCPWCKGRGFEETTPTKCIKCLIKWNPEDADNFGVSMRQNKGVVRFKTFLTEVDDLIRAKTAVSNKDIEGQLELRVKLIQGPTPVGLRERRYCISFWELV